MRYSGLKGIISVLLVLALFMTPAVHAALIHGAVYDLALQKVNDVRIEINTVPNQIFIAKNGTYGFNVPPGEYALKAYAQEGYAEENITVTDNNGEYIIDMVLAPSIHKPVIIETNFTEPAIEPKENPINWLSILLGVIAIIAVGVAAFYLFKHKKSRQHAHHHEEQISDEYGKKVLHLIKKEKRMTQKDLRKQIPLSEGKISLIVSHLEHEGKIKKIKKGRGNILVFVKE